MNRRSFISKALAGLVAVPLIGKLVNSQPDPVEGLANVFPAECNWQFADVRCPVTPPKYYAALIEHTEDGLREVSAKGYQRVPIREIGEPLHFPIAEEDWGYVTHFAFAESPTGPISRLFDVFSYSRRNIYAGQQINFDIAIH